MFFYLLQFIFPFLRRSIFTTHSLLWHVDKKKCENGSFVTSCSCPVRSMTQDAFASVAAFLPLCWGLWRMALEKSRNITITLFPPIFIMLKYFCLTLCGLLFPFINGKKRRVTLTWNRTPALQELDVSSWNSPWSSLSINFEIVVQHIQSVLSEYVVTVCIVNSEQRKVRKLQSVNWSIHLIIFKIMFLCTLTIRLLRYLITKNTISHHIRTKIIYVSPGKIWQYWNIILIPPTLYNIIY